jgi:integrase
VPERLRERVGKREIKFSLGTSDPAIATIRQAQELARWRARFVELDREIEQEALSRAPALVDGFLQAMAHRNGDYDSVVYGIQKFIVLRLFSAWGQEEFTDREADRAFAFMPNRAAWCAGDLDADADLIPGEEREETLARVLMLNRSRDTQGVGFSEVLQRLLCAGRWRVLGMEVVMVADHAGTEIAADSALFDAVAEQLLRRLVYHVPRHVDEKVVRYFSRVEHAPHSGAALEEKPPPPAPLRPAAKPPAKAPRPLSVAWGKWLELRAPRPQSCIEAKRAVSRFIDIHGDLPVAAITREHILEYRDVISRIPKNVNLQKLKVAGGSLRELARSEVDLARRLSPGAVRKDVGVIAAILALVRNEGWIDGNVATGTVVAGYSKTRQRQRTPRLPLRRSMMETLFASPLFTGCEGLRDVERTRPGPKVYQDALYWTFLFGATAGPRLEEIGQIKLDDIEIMPRDEGKPIVVIYVTGTGAGESIKNDESARVIVVHPRLLDLGFLEYVEKRRAAGAERLFDLKQSATGKWTKELSRRVNRYVDRVVTDDPRYVFHSMRHEFKDRAEETISTRVHDRITGHTPATVGGRYGLGASIDLIAREIEKLDLSFVDWRRLSEAAGRQAPPRSLEHPARPQDRQARLPGF